MNSGGIITKPVRLFQDVQPVIGSTGDLGSIIVNGNINKWAKFKPVKHVLFPNRATDWWEGSEYNCGINYPKYSSLSQLVSAYDSEINWTYIRPNQYYSLLDFDGYNHNALFDIESITYPSAVIIGNDVPVTLTLRPQSSDVLRIKDIGGANYDTGYLGDYYFGIYVEHPVSGKYLFTSSTKIKDLSLNVESLDFPTVSGNAVTYTAYPLICSQGGINTTNPSSISGVDFIPLHKQTKFLVDTTQPYVYSLWSAWSNLHSAEYSITIRNNTSNSKTFSAPKIAARYSTSAWGSSLQSGETVETISDIVVPAGSEITISGEIDAEQADYSGDWWFWFVVNTGGDAVSLHTDII